LEQDEYEIAYEGLDGDDMAVDGNIIARLDLQLTPELEREGIAREISRFLNQMRKDAGFNIDDRVALTFVTTDGGLTGIMKDFAEFFQREALIKSIDEHKEKLDGDIVALFTSDDKTIEFALKR
jgi:isoleucyl-tRNA synthetase